MSARSIASALVLVAVASGTAHAEEGVVTAQVTGGAVVVDGTTGTAVSALDVALDLGLTDTYGPVASLAMIDAPGGARLGLGLGAKVVPLQSDWTRLYVRVTPQLLLAPPATQQDTSLGRSSDLAIQATVGVEHLLMWGLGVALEVSATAPTGLGAQRVPPWAGALAGLYMEM